MENKKQNTHAHKKQQYHLVSTWGEHLNLPTASNSYEHYMRNRKSNMLADKYN